MKSFDIFRYRCLRCDHQWSSKQDRPRVCPKCKNPYWDTIKDLGGEIKPIKRDWTDRGPIYKEFRKRIEHNKWGRWKYNPSYHTLDIVKNVGGKAWLYQVILDRCDTGAKLLDWIYQVQGKTWIGQDDVADLVYAVGDILFSVQSKLCSFGQNLSFDVSKYLTEYIDPILTKR